MKLLKKNLPAGARLTLINDAPKSYYSGMLPGTVSSKILYRDNKQKPSFYCRTLWWKLDSDSDGTLSYLVQSWLYLS